MSLFVVFNSLYFHQGTNQLTSDSIEVYAGANSISSLDGPNVQNQTAPQPMIHPNFKLPITEIIQFGYNDVAIIQTMIPFEETPFVQPIPLGYLDWTNVVSKNKIRELKAKTVDKTGI